MIVGVDGLRRHEPPTAIRLSVDASELQVEGELPGCQQVLHMRAVFHLQLTVVDPFIWEANLDCEALHLLQRFISGGLAHPLDLIQPLS